MNGLPSTLWDATATLLDAAASGEPILESAVGQAAELIGCERGDAGFVSEPSDVYDSSVVFTRDGVAPARISIAASDPLVGAILASDHAIGVSNVEEDLADGVCRSNLLEVGTKAVLARRLDYDGAVFGLVCLDWLEPIDLTQDQLSLVDEFISVIVAPLVWSTGLAKFEPSPRSLLLSEAEREVVSLAARGCSYAEIAQILGKSPNTVDHQLASARCRLGARNTAHLIELIGSSRG